MRILLDSSSNVLSFFLVATYYDAIVALIQGSRIWTRALLLQLTHTETQGVILVMIFVALFNRLVNISLIVVIYHISLQEIG